MPPQRGCWSCAGDRETLEDCSNELYFRAFWQVPISSAFASR